MINNYLEVVYNPDDKPYTEYPKKLVKYLTQRYQMKPGDKFLIYKSENDFIYS